MNLRARLFIIGISLILLQIVVIAWAAHVWIYPKFDAIEAKILETKLQRDTEIILRELFHLQQLAQALSENQTILKAASNTALHLPLTTSEQLPLMMYTYEFNMLYVLNNQARVQWEKLIDIKNDQSYPHNMVLSSLWTKYPALITHRNLLSMQAGLYLSPIGPMMLVSAPIASHSFPPTVAGTLIIGKMVSAELLEIVNRLSINKIELWPMGSATLSPAHQTIFDKLYEHNKPILIERNGDVFYGYSSLNNLSGQPTFLVSTKSQFAIQSQFNRYLFAIIGWIVFLEGVFLVWVLWGITTKFVSPLRQISAQLYQVDKEGLLLQGDTEQDKHVTDLVYAFQGFFARQFLRTNRETLLSYREGCHHTRHIMLQGFDQTTQLCFSGFNLLEKQLSAVPTKNIAEVVSQLRTDKIPVAHRSHIQAYADKLEMLNSELGQYQRDTRRIIEELQNKALRNAALVRANSRNLTRHTTIAPSQPTSAETFEKKC